MKKFRERVKGNAGFTLIELLVVIAVLGILAGIAVPRLTGVQDKAIKATLQSTAATVRNAMEIYYADNGEYPDLSKLTDGNSLANFTEVFEGEVSISFSSDNNVVIKSAENDSSNPSKYSLTLRDSKGKDSKGKYEVTLTEASIEEVKEITS